ncbi:MAG: DUF1365 domain-containing protein [Cellvibrionales bacterium]|nr:DUF1365 domain-containing protein [Cellvibrionales bacterium]
MTPFTIYRGSVRHRRYTPKSNQFTYSLTSWLIDLDQVDRLQQFLKRTPFSFLSSNYLSSEKQPLKDKAQKLLNQHFSDARFDKIYLLTQLRCAGFLINPISVYFCYRDNQMHAMIAEVTNTPWGEKQNYVLSCDPDVSLQRITFEKRMHVSPFNDMDLVYQWMSKCKDNKITIHIGCEARSDTIMDATLMLKKEKNQSPGVLMTWKIAALIYWQALKLIAIKRIPFYSNPK